MTFDNNINWYMHEYLEINNMQTYIYLLLITLNIPLQVGKCTPGDTGTPGWEPLESKRTW